MAEVKDPRLCKNCLYLIKRYDEKTNTPRRCPRCGSPHTSHVAGKMALGEEILLTDKLKAYLEDNTVKRDRHGNIIEGDEEGKRLLRENKYVREYLGLK